MFDAGKLVCMVVVEKHRTGTTTLWFKKNLTTVKSSNSCTEYDIISVIFGLENHQMVFSLQVSNWRVFMKLGTSFGLYMAIFNLLQQTMLKWVYAMRTIF